MIFRTSLSETVDALNAAHFDGRPIAPQIADRSPAGSLRVKGCPVAYGRDLRRVPGGTPLTATAWFHRANVNHPGCPSTG
jgi:hypothetical protein